MEERGGPKMPLWPLRGSLLQGALAGGESESLIPLPNSTESIDSGNTRAGRMFVIVTGWSLSWLWGCFVGFFKIL